jgi:hypothetical protein
MSRFDDFRRGVRTGLAGTDRMGFWAGMRESFERGRAGLPWRATAVERTMSDAYAAASGRVDNIRAPEQAAPVREATRSEAEREARLRALLQQDARSRALRRRSCDCGLGS